MKIRLGISTIIAKSKAFHEVVELAQRIAALDGATVLILGESGTGNVRELENVVENLVITTPGDVIKLENLPEKFRAGKTAIMGDSDELLPLKVTVERAEQAAINRAIQQCGYARKAASVLGVDPSTIVRKMQNYKGENKKDQDSQ